MWQHFQMLQLSSKEAVHVSLTRASLARTEPHVKAHHVHEDTNCTQATIKAKSASWPAQLSSRSIGILRSCKLTTSTPSPSSY